MQLRALEQSFNNLRQVWPHAWPGLPVVLRACVARLGGVSPRGAAAKVVACALALAQDMERHGQRMGAHEPPYHNRLHTADTLVSLTFLLQAQRVHEGQVATTLQQREALMLLAMLGHDAEHPGTRNRYPFELERRSARRVLRAMRSQALSQSAQAEVEALILATEPTTLRQSASRALSACRLSQFVCRAALIREADILSSALPVLAPSLTRALAKEWGRLDAAMGRRLLAPQAREKFLRDLARFDSPAAQALGLAQVVARQSRP